MCGIAGIVCRQGPAEPGLLERMASRLHHRGPDARGVRTDANVGLAHARLSIIDLSGGAQPMRDDDTGVAITFNGEIFNYIELRDQLAARGHAFRTRSDTEVLLRAYLEWGDDCVSELNGQWAFAIWDPRRRRLFASRDRVGIRPLYYARAGDDFVFASEIKALFEHPELRPEVDLEALDDIFTFWSTRAPSTFFAGVRALPPGHALVYRDGQVRVWAYWRLDYPEPEPLDEATAIEQTASLLTDAVRLRLRADVPVGAYLSGGLDSSLTVGLIRHRTETPLETFSVTFADSEFDESEHQRLVVERNQTDHHTVRCDGSEIGRVFPDVVWHTETPVIRTAPAPLYLLSSLVREQGFKVVVTGEGADEVFGGYDIFKEAKIRRFWHKNPDSSWRPLLLRRLYPYMPALQAQPTAYLKGFFHISDEPPGPFFSHTPRWELTRRLRGLFAPEVRERLAGRDALDILRGELPAEFGRWDPFCQAQYLEASILLPGYILASQGDRMGMAHSVEGRFPFLDHRVVELASRLSPHLKMKVLDEKYVLKRVAEPLVPSAVVKRPKQPYRAPDAVSFFDDGRPRFEYVADLLSQQAVADVGLFAPRAVQSLVKKCVGGGKLSVRDNMALVGILSTQLVMRRFKEEFHG